MFRHADVVCLSLVCILWQFSMLVEDSRGDHMEDTYSRAGLMISVRTVVKLCTLGVFALGVSLVSWIVMQSAFVL